MYNLERVSTEYSGLTVAPDAASRRRSGSAVIGDMSAVCWRTALRALTQLLSRLH